MEAGGLLGRRVAVIGCGLVGGSFALAALAAGAEVSIHDTDPSVRRSAQRHGLSSCSAVQKAVEAAEIVLIATPPSAVEATYRQLSGSLDDTTIVTDTASAKGQLAASLAGEPRFIPGHPMAGSQHSGFSAATRDLFRGCVWTLCPSPTNSPHDLTRLAAVLTAVGAGRILRTSPQEHDRAVAAVSHLPQLAATLVAANAGREETVGPVLDLAAGGFDGVVRTAVSPAELWAEILLANSHEVARQLAALAADADRLIAALRAEDPKEIVALMDAGRRAAEQRRRPAPETEAGQV